MRRVKELRAAGGSFAAAGDEVDRRLELAWTLLQVAEGDGTLVEEALGHALWLLGRWRVAGTLRLAGSAYRARYAITGDPADRDAAILLLSEVGAGELSWTDHATVAQLRSERFQTPLPFGNSRDDMQGMIAHWRDAIARCDDQQAEEQLRALLGLALARRSVRWQESAEQDEREADTLLTGALDRWPGEVEYALGQIRLSRGERTGELSTLDSGIALVERSRRAITDAVQRREALSALAAAYAAKKDPGRAVTCLRQLWDLLPEDDLPSRAEVAGRLGHTLFDLANRDDADPALCDQAIETLETALRLMGKEGDARLCGLLGTLHTRRYTTASHADDRAAAIRLMRLAVSDGAEGLDPELAELCHSGLGAMLMEQAIDGLPDLAVLETSIAHLERSEHSGVMLGQARSLRAELLAERPAQAVPDLEEAVAELSPDDPERPEAVLALAKALMGGVSRGPGGVDLDRVLALAAEAESSMKGRADLRVLRTFVHAVRAIEEGDEGAFSSAMSELESMPAEEPFWRELVPSMVAFLLATRFTRSGSLADVDAAGTYLAGVKGELPGVNTGMITMLSAGLALAQGMHRESPEVVERAIADLEEARRQLGEQHPSHRAATALLSQARNGLRLLRGEQPSDDLRGQQPSGDLKGEPVDRVRPDEPYGVMFLMQAARARIGQGVRQRDVQLLDSGIEQLREGLNGNQHAFVGQGLRFFLANALVERFRIGHDRADLDEGIAELEALGEAPTVAPMELARAYRLRDEPMDSRRALDTGLMGLRARYRQVIVQTGTERALAMSKQTSVYALTIASWALDDGQAGLAVHALELGRGLVLAAGTAATTAGALLRELGEHALADEWERADAGALTSFGELDIPSDLRSRVLRQLGRSGTMAARLLDPPSPKEIAAGLGRSGALVYLLPPVERRAGRAVVVTADARLSVIDLPGLDASAMARIGLFSAMPQTSPEWPSILGKLCVLAHEAVVGPLLDHVGGGVEAEVDAGTSPGAELELVLVPWGLLGVVPWHAARAADGYACRRARFSVAASGRQLLAAREPLDPGAHPVIVSDPAGEVLRWARWECDELWRLHYPGARRLGRWHRSRQAPVEQATAEALLPFLPGGSGPQASVLHIGGHASSASSSGDSHLLMAGDERLPVETILRQAGTASGRGGVVVLSSCSSDHTRGDHDEALTLATAFLAAGSAGVIGSRWMVGDDPRTAVMMVVFHGRLAATGSAGQALHESRMWMLDEHRIMPEGLSPELRDAVAGLDLTDPAIWAAFTHQGYV